MPAATFEVWVYLHSVDNARGWLFGSENGGCDRYIVLHDDRVGGTGPSCQGTGWGLGSTPIGQWSHVVALFDQDTGTSYAFLNGVKGTVRTNIFHSDGVPNEVRLGSPSYNPNYYANADVAAMRVYNRLLSDDEVATLYSDGPRRPPYRAAVSTTPSTSAPMRPWVKVGGPEARHGERRTGLFEVRNERSCGENFCADLLPAWTEGFDFESVSEYFFLVSAVDAGILADLSEAESLETIDFVEVVVSDRNEKPVVQPVFNVSIEENVPVLSAPFSLANCLGNDLCGAVSHILDATDPDGDAVFFNVSPLRLERPLVPLPAPD